MLDIESPPLTKQVYYLLYVNRMYIKYLHTFVFHIIRLDKPYFSHINSSFEVIEYQSFNITLTANAYPLPISYSWFHPTGRQLMNDQLNIFVNDSHLSLMNIQRNDFGVYRCLATNSLGTTEVNFTLNILCMSTIDVAFFLFFNSLSFNILDGPVITRTQGYPVSEALISGSSATLLCVIDANPVDLNTVRWHKAQQEISFDQWEKHIEGKEVSLIRKSIQRDDAGEYTCEVENQFGTNRATLPLFIQCKFLLIFVRFEFDESLV